LVFGLIFVTVAAFYAATANIVSGISRSRLSAMAESADPSAQNVLGRYLRSDTFVQARWRALRAVGLAAGTLLLLDGVGAWLVTLAMVAIVYVLVSQLMASLLRATAERATPWLLTLAHPAEFVVLPIVDPIVALTRLVARPMKESIPSPAVAEAEVEMLVNESEQRGALDHDQSEMIRNVLEFGDTQACDLMVPRRQIKAIEIEMTPQELLKLVVEQEHSRYPVYDGSIDDVVGILHVKDLFLFTASHRLEELQLPKLLRKAVFVPETQRAASVLQQLRSGRHHMAIVLDEFGGVSGVLTLEDLLEEIVGVFQVEHDHEDSPILRLSSGNFVVDASIPVADLNRQLGISIPDDEEYNSLGGYIVEEMGRVPEAGTVLERADHRFLIRMADERRVAKVEITPPPLRAAG
jgi:putative hemolysin